MKNIKTTLFIPLFEQNKSTYTNTDKKAVICATIKSSQRTKQVMRMKKVACENANSAKVEKSLKAERMKNSRLAAIEKYKN